VSQEREHYSEKLKVAKKRLLKMHYDSQVGHLGGNLSCLDTLLYLYLFKLKDTDRFTLSKGHSAGALYICLWLRGILSEQDLTTFHQENTLLPGHPPANKHDGINFATGSLGHGPALSAGESLARKLQNKPGRSYCLISDGELNEGSVWEAFMFIAHHQLNVTVIIDCNGLQGFGSCQSVLDLGEVNEKLKAFHLNSEVIDGHSFESIAGALKKEHKGPFVILAKTKKGKGVEFEGMLSSHYLPLSESQYNQAIKELEK